jgi:hypothetical protein
MKQSDPFDEDGFHCAPLLNTGAIVYAAWLTPWERGITQGDIETVLHCLDLSVSPTAPHFQRFLHGGLN